MKFLALVAALLLEQVRPLRHRNRLYESYGRLAAALEERFNGGQFRHGLIAWLLAAGAVVLPTLALSGALSAVSSSLGWAWSVAVLYLTMGIRQSSHYFTEILRAAGRDDLEAARAVLGEWRGESAAEFSETEVARVAIEEALLASHRCVFGTIAWFIVLGPAGAVLYRAADMLAARWGSGEGEFGGFASRFFFVFDWVPARLTALTFAVVGNFEDAVYCWRAQAVSWATRAHGVILAAGAGALGVRLGDPLRQAGGLRIRPELGTGNDPDVSAMEGTVRLVWRSLVLWMFLVFIVSVAHALG